MSLKAKKRLMGAAAHSCAMGVAAVFLAAAYFKIDEPRDFANAIKGYHMLPERFINLAALFLPWVEVVGAAALVVPRTRRAGAILVSGMCVMFIIAVSYAGLYKGYSIDCGCFGKHSTSAGLRTISLDVVLLLATGLSVYLPARMRRLTAGMADATLPSRDASARFADRQAAPKGAIY